MFMYTHHENFDLSRIFYLLPTMWIQSYGQKHSTYDELVVTGFNEDAFDAKRRRRRVVRNCKKNIFKSHKSMHKSR